MLLAVAAVVAVAFMATKYTSQAMSNLFVSVVGFRIHSINFTNMSVRIDIAVNNASNNTYSLNGSYFVVKYPIDSNINSVLGTFYLQEAVFSNPNAVTKFTVAGDIAIFKLATLIKDYFTNKDKLLFEIVGTLKTNNLINYTGKVFEGDFRTYMNEAGNMALSILSTLALKRKN